MSFKHISIIITLQLSPEKGGLPLVDTNVKKEVRASFCIKN